MSEPAYLIVHQKGAFQRLNAAFQPDGQRLGGNALYPLSAMRSVLPASAANELARREPGRPLLRRLQRTAGVVEARAVAPGELVELHQWREVLELPTRTAAAPAPAVAALVAAADTFDWHLDACQLPAAWALLGGVEHIDYGDVIVGHIDTGFTPHPCLGWQDGSSPWVLTDRDRNFYYAELYPTPHNIGTFTPRDPNSAEDPVTGPNGGHGTRTSSVLSGYAPDANYYGAAPRVPLIPVRITNSVWINNNTDGLADALDWLIERGCQVITMSLGVALPPVLPGKVTRQIDRAYERGIIYVCAAGNLIDAVVAPARYPRTVAVGGTTLGGVPWSGSSHGATVDVSAPADQVRRGSVDRGGRFGYGQGDGTSFATQLVGGAAALWLARHRDALAAYAEPWQRVAAFVANLKASAKPPQGVAWNANEYGTGILQAADLLAMPLPAAASLQRDAGSP
ncbi:S8/S53 family peptidase [Chitinivorax sp. PXF-14]|uniref:S8 family peptidase n=1 Tax=Chitinivorax sp. PXF-14 TaxID=3230488 RepID=UPI0034670204